MTGLLSCCCCGGFWAAAAAASGLLLVQGIVGSTPWNALVFNTLYLQLLGMSDFQASLIAALFLGGTAVGALVRCAPCGVHEICGARDSWVLRPGGDEGGSLLKWRQLPNHRLL